MLQAMLSLESPTTVVILTYRDKSSVFLVSQACDKSPRARFHGRCFLFFLLYLPRRGEHTLAWSSVSRQTARRGMSMLLSVFYCTHDKNASAAVTVKYLGIIAK